jgi:hypothetical protein
MCGRKAAPKEETQRKSMPKLEAWLFACCVQRLDNVEGR